ncbi:MAG: hypothetical protein HYR85_10515 [Planctomycetes bacterium]|nr:hypothetical protein [Planctomycetota bacterium]MBI3845098.1 hypothetical protein [Planctomycetota bacterium]
MIHATNFRFLSRLGSAVATSVTYQTKAWTLREWSRHLDVVEYVERGMGGYQDLVVLRRP